MSALLLKNVRPGLDWLAGMFCRLLMQLRDLLLVALWHPALLLSSLRYLIFSLGRSPYRVQNFEQRLLRGRFKFLHDDLVYGETPWWTLRHMLRFLRARPGERFVDLGSGNGRSLKAAIELFKMRATGYELLQTRHALATHMLHKDLRDGRAQLHHDQICNAKLERADIVLLTWTCMSAPSRHKISEHLRSLKAGARLVTITYQLDLTDDFLLLRHDRLCFSWGRGEVYFYQKQ